jgi:LCP family protein required for cell wall assembly
MSEPDTPNVDDRDPYQRHEPDTPPPGIKPPRPKKRKSFARRFFLSFLAFILIIVVAVGALVWYAWGKVEKVDAIPDSHGDAVSAGRVFLLVGSDSRDDLSDEERRELGTGSVSGKRTDTIMLLHLPTSGRPALVSLPRDSVVDIPGNGSNRINAAYAFGGAPLLVETIEQNTGVAIDEYVEVGFGGFAGIVDALGGVEVCLDDPIEDKDAHIDLPAGCQTLDGPDALGFARARKFDPRGDIGRVERQREMISAIVDKAKSPSTLLNPAELAKASIAGGDALVVDEGTGPLDMYRFIRGLMATFGDGGDSITVPLGRVGNTVDWDPELAGELWDALRDGTSVPQAVLDAQ